MSIAIRAEGLSKQYKIGRQRLPYDTFREMLVRKAKAPFRWIRELRSPSREEPPDRIWALKDVSFEVKQGEVVGVIGRNGAGKSTLLKILTRITEPTEGRAELRGRVASLLEVGTGFHPELTGRENIYLNGTILGMKKSEIDKHFDEIIAFSEIEKFLDTPVKRYSSGMRVRLAFSVAAHLSYEILLVDEVLAVGDFSFQKKCLGKMEEVSKKGRTVLLVSHNTQVVSRVCGQALLLEGGSVQKIGNTHEVIMTYLRPGYGERAERSWGDLEKAPGDEVVRLKAVRARTVSGDVKQTFGSCETLGIDIVYTVFQATRNLVAEIVVYNEEGALLFTSANQYDYNFFPLHPSGTYASTCWIPGDLMTDGTFFLRISILHLQIPKKFHVFERDVISFQVVDHMEDGSARGRVAYHYPGFVRPKLKWETKPL